MMRIRSTSLLFCYFLTINALAQSPTSEEPFVQKQLENIITENQQEETDYSTYIETLTHYKKHPINLNHTRFDELQQLNLLTDLQIHQLFSHMEKNGKLASILELQAIKGFDLELIQTLLPYVYVSDPNDKLTLTGKKLFDETEQIFIFRYSQVLEKQLGFRSIDASNVIKNPNSRYVGGPQKVYARYQIRLNSHIGAGFTAEKDPGETFLKKNIPEETKNARNGFDFYSANIFIQHLKYIQMLAIGDYTLTFGQGLTIWNAASFGKSSVILYAKKTAQGIRPYTSVDENKFMRGMASTLRYKKIFLTVFYSHKAIDATIHDTLDNGSALTVSSLQQTGSHATLTELKNKHSVHQTILGNNITYRSNRLCIGATWVHDFLDLPLKPASRNDSAINTTSKNNTIGIDYNFIFQNFNFFGEISRNKNASMAFLNGVFISLHPKITFTAVHRSYTSTYQNELSAGFSESSNSNEKGFYMGITIKLLHAIEWTSCFDRFEFRGLRYQADAPSYGNDACTQLTYAPSKKLTAHFRISQRTKQQNTSNPVYLKYLVQTHYTNYRFTISYQAIRGIQLSNRVEYIIYKEETTSQNGFLLYQDIHYTIPGKSFSILLRYALFQTDGYNARIYAYENDVSGSLTLPAYYDKGSRFYLLLNYTFNKHLEAGLKFSQTVYEDKEKISEGTLTEIEGNRKSEIKVQMRMRF